MPDNFRLDGKVALVTGAASGIGAAVAGALAQAGALVMLTDIAEGAGQHTAGRLREAGHRAQFLPQDVVDEARWTEIVAATEGAFGGLDVLVNNAGIETAALIAQCELAGYTAT